MVVPAPQRAPTRLPAWTGVRGFIDIHSHVLPAIDDGPKTREDALAIAEEAWQGGTMAMVATPHFSFDYRLDLERRAESLRRLQAELPGELLVFPGCELQLNDEALRAFRRNPREYTLNRSRYVLIELLPQTGPPNVEHVLSLFLDRGYAPILAHPERYPHLHARPERLMQWVQHGCLMQLTADSLSGRMGRRARAASLQMLRNGLVHFVASDAHHALKRPPNLLQAYRTVAETAGVAHAARLFAYNPLAVLRDEPLPAAAA